jgi:hypothetical protein
MDAIVAERVEQLRREPRQHPQSIGEARRRRFAGARDVKDDHLPIRIKSLDERVQQFEAGAKAVEDQQRHARPFACPQTDAQVVT